MNTSDTIRKHLEQAIALDPDYTAARYLLAMQLLEADLLPAAQQAFTESVNCATRSTHKLVERATKYRSTNDFAKAKGYMQKMLEENRLAANACCQLGDLLSGQGDNEGAREQYSAAVEFDPTCARAYYELGMLEKEADMVLVAREHFYKVIEHEFNFAAAHLQLSMVITADDEFDLAQNHYLIALDLDAGLEDPELSARFRYNP
ncbi:tetratricopeptide repeat protein [Candidatus Neomarinimicrobiota bacterium]